MLAVDGVSKSFGPTQALVACSLGLQAGEVHVLMGENGSGKSTLVKILSGVHRPDAGSITLSGTQYGSLPTPHDAARAGVATVFQEILIVPQQSVLANIWLGNDGLLRQRVEAATRRRHARETIARLIEPPDLETPAAHLSLNDRQAICIARALLHQAPVLILDEATSALDVRTRDSLFAVLRELQEHGTAILMISHRMDEVEEMADRITVMRSGRNVGTLAPATTSTRDLVELMVGGEHPPPPVRAAAVDRTDGIAIRASGIRLSTEASAIDVEFRAGEIVGLAGLEGHGQDLFLQVLSGVKASAGAVVCHGPKGKVRLRSRADALAARVAYVPRDRRDESVFATRSILENFAVASITADRRAGLVLRRLTWRRFQSYVDRLRITAGRRTDPITSLSGGNQQKVIIARWLAREPRVLLLNDPTRGVDMGAKADIYQILRESAAKGLAVVMVSTELEELVGLMDRVLVFRENAIFREFSHDEVMRERLVAAYFGSELE